MKKLRHVFMALLVTLFIVGSMEYSRPIPFDRPDLILAQDNVVAGIPEEIQGVWDYEGDMNQQSITLRGNQLSITDDFNGTVYYTVDSTYVEPRFTRDGIEDTADTVQYTITTDINDYIMRYGDDAAMSTTDTFYFVYDMAEDSLISQANVIFRRNSESEKAYIIKDNLINRQPINNEHLSKVDKEFLTTTYKDLADLPEEEIFLNLYRAIADNYPEIGLIRNKDYETYRTISQEIISNHSINYPRLNQANPAFIVDLYNELNDSGQDEGEIIKQMIPEIEAAIQDFHNRKLNYENLQRLTFDTP